MSGPLIGLDNAAFSGRLRQPPARPGSFTGVLSRPAQSQPQVRQPPAQIEEINQISVPEPTSEPPKLFQSPDEVLVPTSSEPQELQVVRPQPFVQPAAPRQQRSQVLRTQLRQPGARAVDIFGPGYHRLMLSLVGMACVVFVAGLVISFQTLRTNHSATAQISTLVKQAGAAQPAESNKSTTATAGPSLAEPSARSFSQYVVAPDLPRYLKVPKLGVNARVLQVGTQANGDMSNPNNIYDVGWFAASAKPGQTGAVVINGYGASGSTPGVFYDLNKLQPGDVIQIERGDGLLMSYKVVKSQIYNGDKVDMQAVNTPATAGKPGLNLVTSQSGSNLRLVVFTEQS